MSTDRQKDREKNGRKMYSSLALRLPLPSFLRLVLGEEMPRCRFIPRFFRSFFFHQSFHAKLCIPPPSVLRWVFIENNKIAADKDLPGRRRVRDPIPALPPSLTRLSS